MMLAGCSNGGGGNDGGTDATAETGPQTCTADTSCSSSGQQCWFAIDGGCGLSGSQGVCLTYIAPQMCTPNVACGCDGTTVTLCGPAGYVDRFSAYAGPCPMSDAGPEASVDAGLDGSDDGTGE